MVILSRRRFTWYATSTGMALTACNARTPAPASLPTVELLIESNGDLLEFKPRELTCHAGDPVRLTFHHTGKYVSFQHNWVLIVPGSFEAITAASIAAGESQGWLPTGDKRILAFVPMCGKGQSATTEFIAPAAGDYPFICTSPGHAQSMWGVLHVKGD